MRRQTATLPIVDALCALKKQNILQFGPLRRVDQLSRDYVNVYESLV